MAASPPIAQAIANDPEVCRLTQELDHLREKRLQFVAALSARVQQIRGEFADRNRHDDQPADVFKTHLSRFQALDRDERDDLVRECYEIDEHDQLDVIPDLKDQYRTLLSEFELKMGDEFPKIMLMRLIQMYRWLRTFRKRFQEPGRAPNLQEALYIVDKFIGKSARLIEDDISYVMESRSRGLGARLAQILAMQQGNHQRFQIRIDKSSAFRPVSPENNL